MRPGCPSDYEGSSDMYTEYDVCGRGMTEKLLTQLTPVFVTNPSKCPVTQNAKRKTNIDLLPNKQRVLTQHC